MKIYLASVVLFLALIAVIERRIRDGIRLVQQKDKIVANSIASEPILRSFVTLFPDSQHFISYITGDAGKPTWNSKVALYRRYVFRMSIEVQIDRSDLVALPKGEPSYQLLEITTIEALPDGRQMIHYGKTYKITGGQWRSLAMSGGDFAAIGIVLDKEHPLAGFGNYLGY